MRPEYTPSIKYYRFYGYKKPGNFSYFQHRIDGKIVSNDAFWDTKCKLTEKGARACLAYDIKTKKGNTVDVTVYELYIGE